MGSGDLERSLHAEIEQYISGRLSGMQDEIARLQSQLNEALTRLSERLRSETETDAPVVVAIAEHLRNARNAGIEAAASESTRARASSDIAILKASIDDIDAQRSQSDILNALVNRAASFAPRVAFFVVKNERATGWKARGLEGTVGDQSVRELSLPLTSDTLLSAVVRARMTWSGAPGTHAEDHLIHGHFSEDPPQRIVAIPLVAREKAVAVLYADSAGQDSDAVGLEALEMLVRVAGMAVELLAVKRPAPAESRSDASSSSSSPHTASTSASSSSSAASPSSSSSASSSPPPPAHMPEAARHDATPFTRDEPAPQPLTGAPQAETVDVSPSAIASSLPEEAAATTGALGFAGAGEVSAEPATTPSPNAATTPATVAPVSASPLGSARRFGSDAELPVEVSEAERRYHNDARRFARLLVSEIKLYNEQKVKDGRAEGNLYQRLREDIDRSRQMYDKRVAPEVAGTFDYFHFELVNTLAEGDPDKLGADYPGATVSA